MGGKASRSAESEEATVSEPRKKGSTQTNDGQDLPTDPNELKLLKKKYWTRKRFLLHLVFWLLSLYNLITDALFFNKSQEFLAVIRDGRNKTNLDVITNGSFTLATLTYAPGCIQKLNDTIYHPQPEVGPFNQLFNSTYNDLTCLMGFKCQTVFQANPHFSDNNPNGTFFAAIQNSDFWAYIDNRTQGDCSFATLSQTRSIEELLAQYEMATLACFAFLIFAAALSIWTAVHNIINFHRKRLAQFYDFFKYVVEDMSQLCIQIFIFSYQIGIRCWLCTTENGCESACNGRPTSPQIPTASNFSLLDQNINETLILLSLTMISMFANAIMLIITGLYNVRRHPRYLIPGALLSPLFLLGLLTPLTWASWFALIPILNIHNDVAKNVCLAAAIVGSLVFPFVFVGMFYHFFHHSKHDNRVRKNTTQSTPPRSH